MKTKLIIILLLSTICSFSQSESSKNAVYSLINRTTPGYQEQITIEFIASENGKDVFEIDKHNNHLLIKGNNPVSIAAGYNWYLKYYCNAHISWSGSQLNLPKMLPLPEKKYRHIIDQEHRVYMNYCTINYSASWWDWKRWEKEIDFMALNGINNPLSVIGLEAVWYNTLLKYNFTDLEARKFLVGPAFFAWQWMTNIEGHGGPLPKSWIDQRIVLGKQIIQRQIELGMKPIQQGFSGNVPLQLKEKFPNAKIVQQPKWCNFPGAAQLDPLDPLFNKIGKTFLEEEKKLFGTNHLYAADPFHESEPPQKGDEYLKKVGTSINKLLNSFDSKSIWVMQAWSIRKPIVTAVPKDKLLILDLNGKKWKTSDNFWGYPFVGGNLHNFGGRINLHGDLKLLASNQYKTTKEVTPNICGSGLFMEAIEQNHVYYDLAFEIGIRNDSVKISDWLSKYARRRYGAESDNAVKAWEILLKTAYITGTNGVEKSSIICARPAIDVKKSGPNDGFGIPYNNKDLLNALLLLVDDEKTLGQADGYKYDIVSTLRQVLSNYGQIVNKKAAEAFKNKDEKEFNNQSKQFLDLLKDVDRLLLTRDEFSFKKWVENARSFGQTEEEKNLYEYNASMLVTIWGPEKEPHIFDYGWKEWSGLIDQYYYMRWKNFYQMLSTHLQNGTEYKEAGLPLVHGRETFRANDFYDKLANDEIAWIKSTKKFDTVSKENEIIVVQELINKYKNQILSQQ